MLVLSRKLEERIQIGRDITITVLKIKGRGVKIGVEAPEGVSVLRGELIGLPARDKTQPGGGHDPDAGDADVTADDGDLEDSSMADQGDNLASPRIGPSALAGHSRGTASRRRWHDEHPLAAILAGLDAIA